MNTILNLLNELADMYGFMLIMLLSGAIPAGIGAYILHKKFSPNRIRDSFLAICVLLTLPSCTENQRARTLGGSAKVDLPPNTKLVSATWKETDLWYLYRASLPGETPTTLTFQEESSFGLIEGKVVFLEH